MRIIEQSAEIVQPTGYDIDSIYKDIERAARISYKSESKGNAKEFVDRLVKSKHFSPLEFGTVYLKVGRTGFNYLKYLMNPYSQVVDTQEGIFITSNMRVITEYHWEDDLKYLCEPTEYHVKRYTIHCITDRGVTHELVRHRHLSFMQESQRYCNYSKDKFDNHVTFIKPVHLNIPTGQYIYWDGDWCDIENMKIQLPYDEYNCISAFLHSLDQADSHYNGLIGAGWKPQEARAVLPNATKTEIMICGFEDDIKHLLDLRVLGTTGAPHPQVRALLTPIYEQLKDKLY